MTIGAYPSDSIAQGNAIAAPAAGAQFAGAQAVDAGLYEIDVTVVVWGTTETLIANIRLRTVTAAFVFATVATLPCPTGVPYRFTIRRSLQAAQTVYLDALANATAGANYGGVIALRRIG